MTSANSLVPRAVPTVAWPGTPPACILERNALHACSLALSVSRLWGMPPEVAAFLIGPERPPKEAERLFDLVEEARELAMDCWSAGPPEARARRETRWSEEARWWAICACLTALDRWRPISIYGGAGIAAREAGSAVLANARQHHPEAMAQAIYRSYSATVQGHLGAVFGPGSGQEEEAP